MPPTVLQAGSGVIQAGTQARLSFDAAYQHAAGDFGNGRLTLHATGNRMALDQNPDRAQPLARRSLATSVLRRRHFRRYAGGDSRRRSHRSTSLASAWRWLASRWATCA